MSFVVLLVPDESPEIRELSQQAPLSIGRHPSNDLCLPDPDVALMHCRIGWNRREFEITSAVPEGIVVNDGIVAHRVLKPGDTLQVGSAKVIFCADRDQAEAVSEGEPVFDSPKPSPPPLPRAPRPSAPRASARETQKQLREEEEPEVPARTAPLPRMGKASDYASAPEQSANGESADEIPAPSRKESGRGSLLQRLSGPPVRPGERDILRSPLVATLGTGLLVLTLTAGTLWFVIGRNVTERAYQTALTDYEQQRFTQAIAGFEEFLKRYPSHKLSTSARSHLGLSRIEQVLAGATPSYDRGLSLFDEFVRDHRRAPDYNDIKPRLAQLVERISIGSAEAAGVLKKRELLPISESARQRLEQLVPPEQRDAAGFDKIDAALKKAEAALRKHEAMTATFAEIDTALKNQQPFAVFESRRKLLLRYSDLESNKDLQQRLTRSLELERTLVKLIDLDQPAETGPAAFPAASPPFILARLSRTRIDLEPSGTLVVSLAGEACYAADSVTGQIKWQRPVGANPPFAPVPITLESLSLVLWDNRTQELVLCRQRDGETIWRQKLAARPVAAPLVHAGQIFVPLADQSLLQSDALTGRLLGELQFSQPLATAPVLIGDGEQLVVAGEQGVLYTVTLRPLSCVAVTYTGHGPRAIVAPPLRMGDLLLTAENDRKDSASLRVWRTDVKDQPLKPVASARVDGQVRDAAVLRGKQLVVPAYPERLAAFTVSDERNEKALAALGKYQAESPTEGPIFVTLGPGDQLWMTSSKLRDLQITREALLAGGNAIPLGIADQPVQQLDQTLFVTSRSPLHHATLWLAANRQQMVTDWQTVLGGRVLTLGKAPASDGTLAAVLDTGDVFTVSEAKLKSGGYESRAVTTLSVPPDLKLPLQAIALNDARLAVWCGGSVPQLWQLNSDGVVVRQTNLPAALQAPPLSLGGGIALPLPGRLKLIEAPGFSQAVEDLLLPVQQDVKVEWRGLVAVDDKQALALTNTGRLIRVQVRTEPLPHLAEVTHIELGATVDLPPVLANGRLYVATRTQLLCLDAVTLELQSQLALEQPLRQVPQVVQNDLILETGTAVKNELLIVPHSTQLAVRSRLPLEGVRFVGASRRGGNRLQIVLADGQCWLLAADQEQPLSRVSLGQGLTAGPWQLGDTVFAATVNGSLIKLPDIPAE